MNKIYKLHETYFDISKIKSINEDVILESNQDCNFYLNIDGIKTYLGDAKSLSKYIDYRLLYASLRGELDLDIWNEKCEKIKVYENIFKEEISRKVREFVEYWKSYTNKEPSKEYVRDH